ncbi:hypothetical protein [Kordiimonas gwangyangensis]|uniref:hypothetical protein n=1 Tax=Kordiimonas gwangyangensis TaxID=288022 RepID=UPI000375463B|nr:hypothetical protein [Kordiimonas gwangyangensis]
MRLIVATILAFMSVKAFAYEPIPELAPLAPFVGKTWKSEGDGSDESEASADISKWEWAMHGRAVRITHAVGGGSYGGESLIHWDAQLQKIIFRYLTTAGFYTDGVITPTDDGIEVHEYVRGAKSGPTEARSGYKMSGGEMHGWAQFKVDGEWAALSEFRYHETTGETPNMD